MLTVTSDRDAPLPRLESTSDPIGYLRIRPPAEKAAICRSVVENVWPLLAKGEVRPVVDRVLPLSEAAAAHAYIESRQAFGRVLLVP